MNKRLFYLITGLLIFTFIFYSRIIRIRLPKELFLFSPEIKWFFLTVTIYGILFSSFMIYKSFSLYFQKEEKESFLKKIGENFSRFIDESINEGFNFICGFHPHSYDLLSGFARIYFRFFKNVSAGMTCLITFFIRVVISLIFLIDIFYFFQFNYFYKSLFLLIIPMIFKIVFYLLREFASSLEEAEEFLDLEKREGDYYLFSFKEKYNHFTNLDYYVQEYLLIYQITHYLKAYDYFYAWFTIRRNLVVYSLFLVGWLGILIKNLYLLLP